MKSDQVYNYQYKFSKNGILKIINDDGQNRIILYDKCLKQIDIIENVANNAPFGIKEWSDSTIEISIYSSVDWDSEKFNFYGLEGKTYNLGKYKLHYVDYKKLTEGGLGLPVSVDSVKLNSDKFLLQLFGNNKILEGIRIENFAFCNGKLIFSDSIENGAYKEIVLNNGLTNKSILDYVFSSYRKSYCK
jgi:hypothetical protein